MKYVTRPDLSSLVILYRGAGREVRVSRYRVLSTFACGGRFVSRLNRGFRSHSLSVPQSGMMQRVAPMAQTGRRYRTGHAGA